MIFELLTTTGLWFGWRSFLSRLIKLDNTDNIISFTHACGSVMSLFPLFLITNSQLEYFHYYFSLGYFLQDSFHLCNQGINLRRILFLYHHVVSIVLLTYLKWSYENRLDGINTEVKSLMFRLFFWGELSNIPNYLVYYVLHNNSRWKTYLPQLKKIQLYLFGCIRLLFLGYVGYYHPFPSHHVLPKCSFITYLLGVYWTCLLWKKRNHLAP